MAFSRKSVFFVQDKADRFFLRLSRGRPGLQHFAEADAPFPRGCAHDQGAIGVDA